MNLVSAYLGSAGLLVLFTGVVIRKKSLRTSALLIGLGAICWLVSAALAGNWPWVESEVLAIAGVALLIAAPWLQYRLHLPVMVGADTTMVAVIRTLAIISFLVGLGIFVSDTLEELLPPETVRVIEDPMVYGTVIWVGAVCVMIFFAFSRRTHPKH